MKTTITKAGDFIRAVEVTAIAAVPDSFQVQFTSRLSSARNPDEWRSNFSLILQEKGLKALRDEINAVLIARA